MSNLSMVKLAGVQLSNGLKTSYELASQPLLCSSFAEDTEQLHLLSYQRIDRGRSQSSFTSSRSGLSAVVLAGRMSEQRTEEDLVIESLLLEGGVAFDDQDFMPIRQSLYEIESIAPQYDEGDFTPL